MDRLKWTPGEKKIAHRAFEAACTATLAKVMAEFKAKAAAAATPQEMWSVEDFLRTQRREIEETLDYRYSRLPFVFARLIRDGHLSEGQLAGLSDDKLEQIRRFVSYFGCPRQDDVGHI